MSTNLNQIDELRKRASVNYSDAKEALEKCDGDMLEALVYLEKNKKTKPKDSGFFEKMSMLLKKGNQTRFIMHKQDRVIFDVSVNIAALITIIAFPFIEFIAIGMLIALFTGHRFRLQSCGGGAEKINQALDKVCDAADQIKENFNGSKHEGN